MIKEVKKINMAVVGLGNMGKHHARIYSELPKCRLIAVCEKNEKIGEEIAKKYSCHFYSDYKKMLSSEKISGVSLAVPNDLHEKIGLDILNGKINLLIEKPIASTTKEAKNLTEAAVKNNVILTVGHLERFNPAVNKLKEIIKEGQLGEILSIIARRVGPFPPQIKNAGAVVDLAIHDIDAISFILDRKVSDIKILNIRKTLNDKYEDVAELLVSLDDIKSYIQVNWLTPVKIRMLSVTGTKGYAELNYITQKLTLFKTNIKKKCNDFGEFVINFGKPQEEIVATSFQEPLRLQSEHFIHCIICGEKPIVEAADAILILEKIEKAFEDCEEIN